MLLTCVRRMHLEKQMENMKLTNKEQSDLRKQLDMQETQFLRKTRTKTGPNDFETIKIIGRGAFGEVLIPKQNKTRMELFPPPYIYTYTTVEVIDLHQVRLVKHRETQELFAMKKLLKDEMLKKEQVWEIPLFC